MAVKLDKIDYKLLSELDKNSRQTDSELASKVRISRSAVRYRINGLFKKGVIRNLVTYISPAKFGKVVYKLYLKLQDASPKENVIRDYLLTQKEVFWVTKCDGSWDIIVALALKEPYEFYQFLDKFYEKYNHLIVERELSTQIEVPFFTRGYLNGNHETKCIWGGKLAQEEIDNVDYNILKVLATNSQKNVVDIARELNLTARTVQYRIKKLVERKIILAYSLQLNVNSFDYDYYKTIIHLKDMTPEVESSLIEFCKQLGHVLYYIKTLGPWSLELEWEVKGYKQLNTLMNKIREKFGKHIQRHDHLLIVEEHKGEYNTLN